MGWIGLPEKVGENVWVRDALKTDTAIFQLQYKLSWIFMLLYIGSYAKILLKDSPITCAASDNKDKGDFLKSVNDHCWVHGTFLLANYDRDLEIYPGIGGITGSDDGPHQFRYQHYYKWMYFVMLIMRLLSISPHLIWNAMENQRMSRLVGKLETALWLDKNENIEREKTMLVKYLSTHVGHHGRYAYGFVVCEVLSVVVSGILMYLWDFVTGHEFSSSGAPLNLLQENLMVRTDPLAKIFPIVAKCSLKTYGPARGIQHQDYVCILPMNVFNERAAIFFWYYFMVLVALGVAALIFRLCLIFSKRLRTYMLCAETSLTSIKNVRVLNNHCDYSDWFIIYLLARTVEPTLFREILDRFIRELRERKIKVWTLSSGKYGRTKF